MKSTDPNRKPIPNRKKRRLYLLIAVILIIAVIIALAAYFILSQADEKKQYEKEISNQTQTMTKHLLKELDSAQIAANSAVTEQKQGSGDEAQADLSALSRSEQKVVENQLNKIDDEKKQLILSELAVTYSDVVNQQKSQALSMLNDLLAQAQSEWAALEAQGKATAAEKSSFAAEYLTKVNVMEEQMDSSFAAVLERMGQQLGAEGIDSAPIIDNYKALYKKTKEENRSELMDKAIDALKK